MLTYLLVLLPLLVVLLGGWWRMNIVLERQQTAFQLSREIEQFFSRVNSEEQLFIATGDLRHSRDVLILFSDLRPRIERFQHFATENGMLRHGATVIDHFNAFQSGFTGFASQVLDLQTFKVVDPLSGRLIGVNTAIQSTSGSSAGIGFAVLVDTVNTIVNQFIRNALVHGAPWLALGPALGLLMLRPLLRAA